MSEQTDPIEYDEPTFDEQDTSEIDEQRRVAALQFASNVSNNIDELINNATRIANWLVDNPVNAVKGDEGTNEFPLGGE